MTKPVTRTFDEDTPLLTAEQARSVVKILEYHYPGEPKLPAIRAIASGRAVVVPAGDTPGAKSEVAKDAARWRFYEKHYNDTMDLAGRVRLHQWMLDNVLRLGGLDAAIDAAIKGPA